eukprot:scaffold200249_cov43-Prasinocladus_malaysianus.AAC.1
MRHRLAEPDAKPLMPLAYDCKFQLCFTCWAILALQGACKRLRSVSFNLCEIKSDEATYVM